MSIGSTANAIRTMYVEHETELAIKQEAMRKRAKRRTELRLLARKRLIMSRKLNEISAFSKLSDDQILKVIDKMSMRVGVPRGRVIVTQNEPTNSFFVLLKGTLSIFVQALEKPVERVGVIKSFDFVGEGMFASSTLALATVKVQSEVADLLELSRRDFENLVRAGIFGDAVLDSISSVYHKRAQTNNALMSKVTSPPGDVAHGGAECAVLDVGETVQELNPG
eukprot:g3436.t1